MSSLAEEQVNSAPNKAKTDGSSITPEERARLKAKKKAEKLAKKKAKAEKLAKKKNMWNLDGSKSKKSKKKKADAAPKKAFVNTTPVGEKKDCTGELAKDYDPEAVEAAWNAWWEKAGYFKPESGFDIETGKAIQGSSAAADLAFGNSKNYQDLTKSDTYTVVLPPPNVTGSLHLGHALMVAIEDLLCRWKRMCGKVVMWVPGTDHAGIATQVQVEKKIMKEEQLTRHDLGREKFLERVWAWKHQYGNRITTQMRALGASVDWSREYFTADEERNVGVVESFKQMFDKGLIYRANRLVNWSCALKTAISDIEVDHVDIEKKTFFSVPGHDPTKKYEFGTLTKFAYKVRDTENEELVVATTRLETMLGDTAVAIHPEDPRYKHLHGKFVVHPFFPDRKIPIILDPVLVDMEFGTGAVKITPAHDRNDFDSGQRHKLETIQIFTENGAINENGGEFQGIMRFDARKTIYERLESMGLARGKENHKMSLGFCSRSKDVIEPMLKPQWYVDCKDMAAAAVNAVKDKTLTILPKRFEKTWFDWLNDIRDWCISRQLWWGHRIPAYKIGTKTDAVIDSKFHNHDGDLWVVASNDEEALEKAASITGLAKADLSVEQDEDVLDTWFSSGLLPFTAFGWPNESHPDFNKFFPGDVLETGNDILFFWVARMVMMSICLHDGKLPFHTMYLHSLVKDKEGRKMSKSKGNIIDPLEVKFGCTLEKLNARILATNLPQKEKDKSVKNNAKEFPDGIPTCGADALRFGLLCATIPGKDVNLDMLRVVGYKAFGNKVFQSTKFALLTLKDDSSCSAGSDTFTADSEIQQAIQRGDSCHESILHLFDTLSSGSLSKTSVPSMWILGRLSEVVRDVNMAWTNYTFATGCSALHSFWMYDFCNTYLELVKPVLDQKNPRDGPGARTLVQNVVFLCLDTFLRLLHPTMPFLTEELWQHMPGRQSLIAQGKCRASIMLESHPTVSLGKSIHESSEFSKAKSQMATLKTVVDSIRSLKSEYGLTKKVRPQVYIVLDRSTEPANKSKKGHVSPYTTIEKLGKDIAVLATTAEVCPLDKNSAEDMSKLPQVTGALVVSASMEVHLGLAGMVDVAKEVKKLDKVIARLTKSIAQQEKKLANEGFLAKVTPEVLEKFKANLVSSRKELDSAQKLQEKFKSI
eukprot:g3579.t1